MSLITDLKVKKDRETMQTTEGGGERWWLQQSDPQNPEQISNVRENKTDPIKYQKLV